MILSLVRKTGVKFRYGEFLLIFVCVSAFLGCSKAFSASSKITLFFFDLEQFSESRESFRPNI